MRNAEELPPPTVERRWGRHESPFSPSWSPAFEMKPPVSQSSHYTTRRAAGAMPPAPMSDMQALMETAPHGDVPESTLGQMALKERLAEAVDALPERLRWIFEARHYRDMSVRQIAREMAISKTHVDRLYHQAITELRESLS